MAAQFALPYAAPPGNTYPPRDRSQTPSSRGPSPALKAATATSIGLTTLKHEDRPVVVSVTETAASSPPADHIEASEQRDLTAFRPSTPPVLFTPKSRSTPPPQLTIQTSAPLKESPPSHSGRSSATLVRNNSDASQEQDETPVMRSMFPRLDPSVSITQQNYRPTINVAAILPPPPPPPPPATRSTNHYSASVYSQSQSPPTAALQNPWITSQVAALAATSPLRIAEEPPPDLSSAEDLLDLWSIANGQLSQEAKQAYTLGLQCDSLAIDHEKMHLTTASSAVYTLHASGSTVALTRTHPLEASTVITVSNPSVSTPSATSPLLASIFPSLAERATLDSVVNVARTHNMSPEDTIALQTEAMRRIRDAEAASLLWDSDSAGYYFAHPSLAAATNPDVPTALPILISPGVSLTFIDMASRPLLSLDLMEATLTVHTPAVVALSASQYTLDTLLSSLLALLLHLHRNTALLAPPPAAAAAAAAHAPSQLPQQQQPVPHFDPPPTASSFRNSTAQRPSSSASSRRPAAINTRNPHRESLKLSRWLSSRSNSNNPYTHHATSSTVALHQPSRPASILSAITTTVRSPPLHSGPLSSHSPPLSTYSHSHSLHHHHHNPHSRQQSSYYASPYLGAISPKDLESAFSAHEQLAPTMSQPIPDLLPHGVAPELRKETTGVDLSRFQAYDLSDPNLGGGTRAVLRVLYWAFGVLVWVLGVGVGVLAAGVVALLGLGGGKEKAREKKERERRAVEEGRREG